jgi:RND family efflux transporter MFP subunit
MKSFLKPILMAGFSLSVCAQEPAAEPVRIAGITAPVNRATLSSVLPGQIAKIYVVEGTPVKTGQLLIELDKRLESLDVERRKLLAESQSELEAAKHRAGLLQREWETANRLFETNKSISREERDRKETEYKLAATEHERLKMIEMQETLEYRMAVEQMNRRDIRAPFDGVVTRLYLKEGEGCDDRQPLVDVVDARTCEFLCHMPAIHAANLKKDSTVVLEVESGGGPLKREGRVFFISPVVDPASGLREVQVRFDNSDGSLTPGVNAFLLLDGNS